MIETSNETEEESEGEEVIIDEKIGKKSKKCPKINIDMNAIPCLEVLDSDSELKDLGITAFDQNIYEENVMLQVDRALDSDRSQHNNSDNDLCLQKVFDLHSNDSNQDPLQELRSKNRERLDQISDNRLKDTEIDSNFDNKSFDEINKINEMVEELGDSDTNDNQFNEDEEDCDEWKPSNDDYESDEQFEDQIDAYDSEEDLILIDKTSKPTKIKSKKLKESKISVRKKVTDDGSDNVFRKRINEYKQQKLLERHQNIRSDGTEIKNLDEMVKLDNGFQIPKRIWDQLFPYQQTGVRWLWELHQLGCGGIVGDEMGLGKTIQIIAFLCGLSCTRFHDFRDIYTTLGPVLLVCPATVMHQWVAEFHKWWPYFRVAILHQTGSFGGKKETLIKAINKSNGILITTYSGVCAHQKQLLRHDWHYVILDEGHKIRNPDAQVTHASKLFGTPHRLILSGSPIQNNLRELWSLFDFIYPGKLGTLPIFMEHFAVPITQGGYANATQVQIQVAYKMATILRDSIKPYLLRRLKDEVKSSLTLPSKSEQVLFCKLTEEQRDLYQSYIDSPQVKDIMRGSAQIFVGLINLRKICNHPNLFNKCSELNQSKQDFGYYKRSGKMIVVDALLRIWQKQSHKVLVFTQSRQMIKILESFMKYRSYTYLMMDGSTSVQTRQPLIKQFNSDPNIFVFLLTTRVGGIGVNLTGANRVLIYDPDWNPSTDVQARERCWRIGQNRSVTIYRLLSAGTVEEKIYQRQIFKQYLTNRVLKDPKQRRFFKTNDLYELFTLGSDSNSTESSAIFAGTQSEVKVKPKTKKLKTDSKDNEISLPPEKVQELRNRAKLLSKMIADKFADKDINKNESNSSPETKSNGSKDGDKNVSILKTNEKFDTNPKPKHKKQKKGTKFEGKRIKYLVKQDIYREKVPEKDPNEEDEYVLKKLFKRSKVQSALQHDVIESTSTPDYALAEREAETVAKQAITALKKSRELCFSGQSAVNSLSSLKTNNKFGQKRKLSVGSEMEATSSSLINQIKTRNRFETEIDSIEDISDHSNGMVANKEYDTLLADIRNFIAFQSKSSVENRGEATTQEVLDAFKDKLAAHQSAVFKSMLYQLCDFYRKSDKTGVWKLKSEFR